MTTVTFRLELNYNGGEMLKLLSYYAESNLLLNSDISF